MEGILVNGPINVARLEGDVMGIKKVIYIFMDFHSDVAHQTQCHSLDSMELPQYLVKMFEAGDRSRFFDLFLEISGTSLAGPDPTFRGRYKDEIARYFRDQIKRSKLRDINVRYHHVDIRDLIKNEVNDVVYNLHNIVRNIANNFVTRQDYDLLYNLLDRLQRRIDGVRKALTPRHRQGARATVDLEPDAMTRFFDKILTRYRHREIPPKLREILTVLDDRFSTLADLISEAIALVKGSADVVLKPIGELARVDFGVGKVFTYGRDVMKFIDFKHRLEVLVSQIEFLTIHTFSLIVDLFFLRRFLDKDYVTNGIVYTGVSHSLVYIYILVKYFDFKMTKVSYTGGDADADIEERIKKSTLQDLTEVEGIFLPKTFSQCVNMTEFPRGFS